MRKLALNLLRNLLHPRMLIDPSIRLAIFFTVMVLSCTTATFAGSPKPPGAKSVNYGKLPLSFQPNMGQLAPEIQFQSQGPGYSLYLAPAQAILKLDRQQTTSESGTLSSTDTLRMRLIGTTTSTAAVGLEPLPGIVNYFIGNDPSRWHSAIPTYGKVSIAGIYPGISLVFYGNQRQLEYDFVVNPQADPARIVWSIDGAKPSLEKDGSLVLSAPGGPVRFLAPVAYQVIAGKRCPVASAYVVAENTVRFQLGAYDRSQALLIDPILSYFSYLGGTGNDYIGNSAPEGNGAPSPEPTQSVGIDSAGNLYVAGMTTSTDFPVAAPLFPETTKGYNQSWAFVSKFSPDGTKLLYSTYLGGSAGGSDSAIALAVDSAGNAYVTGIAGTNDFPVTSGAFQTLCGPYRDPSTGVETQGCTGGHSQNAFVLKLNPTGSALVYSSFLGGNPFAWGTGIAVDSAGQAYVTGIAFSGGCGYDVYTYNAQYECFPTTSNAAISDISGGNSVEMAFMTVFNASGSGLVYSTLYGDTEGAVSVMGAGCQIDCSAITQGTTISLDSAGNVYIGGRTVSSHLLLTSGAFNTTGSGANPLAPNMINAPGGYGYVAKFAPVTSSGTSLVYSTYFGGGATYGGDVGGVTGDGSGNAFIAGETEAPDFPATAGAYQTQCDLNELPTFCDEDGYVAELNPAGKALVWATYLGDASNAPLYFLGPIWVDSAGDVYVEGEGSGQLPLGGGAVSSLNGPDTVYVAKLNPTGSQVLLGATFGGPGNNSERAGGMVVDPKTGDIYVGGSAASGGTYTGTSGAFQTTFAGGNFDSFVAKLLPVNPSATTLSISPTSSTTGQQITFTATVAGTTQATPVATGTVTLDNVSTTPPTELGTITLGNTGSGTFMTSSLAAGSYSVTATYSGDDNYDVSTSTAQTLTIASGPAVPTVTVTPASLNITTTQADAVTIAVSGGGSNPTPTGKVTLMSGGYTSAAATLTGGSAMINFPAGSLSVGADILAADYVPDANSSATYSSATGTNTVHVSLTQQTITFTAPATPVAYGVTPITLSATATSNLSVVFSVVSGPGTVTGNMLTITGVGTVVIAANQAGNAVYAAAPQVTHGVVVNKAAQTISFTPTSPVAFTTSPITLAATGGGSGNPVVFTVVSGPGTISGSKLTLTGLGTVMIAANQAGNADYTAATQVEASIVVTVIGTVAAPTFTPAAGTYTSAQTVALASTTAGAMIYYTTDGSTPPSSKTAVLYSNPISVTASETINAIAVATDYTSSAVASAAYVLPVTFTASFSPASLTIKNGSSGTTTLTVTPQNGFNSPVSFACSGLPAGASCSFNPATITPTGNAPATSTLTISTGGSTAALHRDPSPLLPETALALGLCFFGLRKRRGILQLMLLLAVGLFGFGLVTGCGGSKQPTASVVTVIVSAGQTQQTASLNVTIDY